ncbi:MAG: glutamate--tRNA ligase, partial [Bacteroidetes bacterium]|nr:glutamate--tRNA ligase [Bacteroidota bacterium]
PAFAHLPLILRPDGNGKLSKRDGDRLGFPVFPLDWQDPASGERSSGYRERGYYPEAFINMLALLGWNPGNDQELMPLQELTALFDLERVHKGGARFDPEKARWFNQQYLRKRPDAELGAELHRLLAEKGIAATLEKAVAAVALLKERATFPSDMLEGEYLFTTSSPLEGNTEALAELHKRWKPGTAAALAAFIGKVEGLGAATAPLMEQAFNAVLEELSLKMGQLMPVYRLCVAGRMQGPGMFDVSALLGREEVLVRLKAGLNAG